MKKFLCLFLALLMCLSLCACGSNNSTESEAPKDNTSILEKASAIKLDKLGSAFDFNRVNAEESYYNKYYTIVGTVKEITSSYVTIHPMDAVYDTRECGKCRVELPVDEIKRLSTDSVIMVCGKLTAFTGNGYNLDYALTLKDAFYVGNVVEITATVSDIHNYTDGSKSIELQKTVMNGTYVGRMLYEIVVAESGAENSEVAEYQGTVYQKGDKVTFTGVLRRGKSLNKLGTVYISYNVIELDTISKNQ